MATYSHNIASLHAKHPALPAILNNLDLNRAINAGDPLSQQELDHARFVALSLKGLHGSGDEALVTADISESARLRAFAIESAHASAKYTPGDLLQQLQAINAQLIGINDRLDGIENRITNIDNQLAEIKGLF